MWSLCKNPINPFQHPSTSIPNPKPSRLMDPSADNTAKLATAAEAALPLPTPLPTPVPNPTPSPMPKAMAVPTPTPTPTPGKTNRGFGFGVWWYVFLGCFIEGSFFDGLSLSFPVWWFVDWYTAGMFLVVLGRCSMGFVCCGDASGRFGCCPVGFVCCGTRDASVMVFGFSWCFVWSFFVEKKEKVIYKS